MQNKQSTNKLKFIAIYRTQPLKIINSVCNEKNEEQIKKESDKVASQVQTLSLNPQERQKINTQSGCWNCTVDEKGIIYIVLTATNYPERHAYAIPSQIQQELQKSGDYINIDDQILKNNTKNILKELSVKYNDLESLDKIYLAQQQVNETSIVMEDNVKKMLQNQQNLDQLSNKADKLNTNAQGFYKNSKDLVKQLQSYLIIYQASIMYWRNMKLKIIMGLIALSGVCYVAVPIIIKYAN